MQQLCRRPEIAWRVIEGEAVVVNPRTGLVYPLNPVGTRCWELTDGTRSEEEIIAVIAEEFDAPKEVVRGDVAQFMRTLQEKGLLDVSQAA